MKNILPPKLTNKANAAGAAANRYKVIIFVLLVVTVYGYIIITISSLSNVQPTPDQVNKISSPIKSAKIDKNIVMQLQRLQDNSVSVKALFDEARNNPFQEN